jgi:polysaccharide pyruvyl transferase WcaK-like protein
MQIAFFGHFDSTNFGNESTLQAILYHLRCFRPDAEITCISDGREAISRTRQIYAIKRFVKSWFPQNQLIRVAWGILIGIPSELYQYVNGLVRLRRTDMLIVPGTGLLTDAYGLAGWGPYGMFKWSLLAKACRCKLLFIGVGAGPIYGVLSRWFVKSALSLADFRSYRDDSSKQYLKSIGFPSDNDLVCPDLVFSLSEAMIPRQGTKTNARSVIGIGVMSYTGMYGVSAPNTKAYLAYLETLVSIVRWLLAHEYDIRLLIGDLADISATQQFKALLTNRLTAGDENRIIDDPVFSVQDLLSQIAATDIVVATRFHNVLLALLCNKPVVSISFHHKCESLMSAMGLSAYCLDINALNADNLIETFFELEKRAGTLKPLICEKVKIFRDILNEQYKLVFTVI